MCDPELPCRVCTCTVWGGGREVPRGLLQLREVPTGSVAGRCGAHLPRSQRKTQEKEITLSQNPADGWKNVQLAQNRSGSQDGVGVLVEQGRPQAENNVKGLWPKPLPCGASGIQHVFTSGPRASRRLRTGLSLDPSLRHWPLPSPFFGAGTRAGRTLGEGQLDESPPPGRVTLARAVRPRRLGPSLSPSFPVS